MEEFRYKKGYNHKEYMFKIWDFGGQEDYYATHQCFISTLALYLLVWNMEKGEQVVPELEGWLDTIAARAPGSNIIIVGTHLDIVRKDRLKYDAEYVQRLHSLVLWRSSGTRKVTTTRNICSRSGTLEGKRITMPPTSASSPPSHSTFLCGTWKRVNKWSQN